MDNIIEEKGKSYIKKSNLLENYYSIISYIDGEKTISQILSYGASFSDSIEFINFTCPVHQIIIEQDDLLYPAYDKLLSQDNELIIESDKTTSEYNFNLCIQRINKKIVIYLNLLSNLPFWSIQVTNLELKASFKEFIDEINTLFINKTDRHVYKLKVD